MFETESHRRGWASRALDLWLEDLSARRQIRRFRAETNSANGPALELLGRKGFRPVDHYDDDGVRWAVLERTAVRKVFVFDLDGTLLTSDKRLSARTLASLQELADRGHLLVLATARPARRVRPLFAPLPIAFVEVCANGAVLRLPGSPDQVFGLENRLLRQAVALAEAEDGIGFLSAEVGDRWLCLNPLPAGDFFGAEVPEVVDRETFLACSPVKILFSGGQGSGRIRDVFEGEASVLVTDGGYLVQVMARGVGKESAVSRLLDRVGLSFDDVVCFGDDHNDLGLFRVCGQRVAMGNAVAELKALATAVTATNDEDGVARYLEVVHR